jgi:pimeloyl-ACP methyl ester carboxylesterase
VERFRTADGRTLSYRVEGTGPKLVCHPGGPGLSSRYFGALAGLGEEFTLVLLDPRGTGGSDRPADAQAYRTEDYVSDLEELRAHLGLDRLLLLGHSHGGVVAAAYAAAYPERAERLVLASTLAREPPPQKASHAIRRWSCSRDLAVTTKRAAHPAQRSLLGTRERRSQQGHPPGSAEPGAVRGQ